MKIAAIKRIILLVFIALIAIASYTAIGYFIPRTFFAELMLFAGVVFLLYFCCIMKVFAANNFKILLFFSLLFRLVFLFAIPQLSDDHFRFMWDGILTAHNISPYLYTPESITHINDSALSPFMQELKMNMNSPSYFSVYPPVLQLIFYSCVKLSGDSILSFVFSLRIFTIAAELGTIYLLIKILERLKQPAHKVLLYALNPLVIIEFAGNLHGESFMIFFLALSFYFLIKEKSTWSAIFLGIAVSTKLLPLIFLPAIFYFTGRKNGWKYFIVTILTTVITFLPFMNSAMVSHIASSIGLYFDKFEFNASIYYLLLWVGYDITGVNVIIILGKILPVFAMIFIMKLAMRYNLSDLERFFSLLLFTLVVYYLFSLVVHPWYITVLVFLSVFTRFKFALIWSALIMLTYSAYLQKPYQEILWITALEYMILAVIIFAELRFIKFTPFKKV
ncbi:MAG: glycosyltransferase 87 family protein [Ferruginibacter sp.]